MTRQEFDDRFAASQESVRGFTDAQLGAINDAVFDKVGGLDFFDGRTNGMVAEEFERAFAAARAA